jgi:hypothetical protein
VSLWGKRGELYDFIFDVDKMVAEFNQNVINNPLERQDKKYGTSYNQDELFQFV